MGLRVETSMMAFKGKTMVGFSWNQGNEYTLTLMDNDGNYERVRIPGYMKNMFEQYWSIVEEEYA